MDHYKEDYFLWQQEAGEFGGAANLFKFKNYVNSDDNVIDFGSGGGYLLKNIKCKGKIGVEINEIARKYAIKNGVQSVGSVNEIENDWADVIISNHALEHAENPLLELKQLHPKLKSGGKIVFVVPHERRQVYDPNNIHQHLFTWSEANLGNLFTRANFKVLKVEDLKYTNPPKYRLVKKFLGDPLFYYTGKIYHAIRTRLSMFYKSDLTQVIILAQKE